MKIKAIIFDFFGVICPEVASSWFKNYFPPEEIKGLMKKYCEPGDRGEMSYSEFLKALAELTGQKSKDVEKEMATYIIINKKLVALIKKLKNKYKLAICSDATEEFISKIISDNKLSVLFDTIVISSVEKIDKPHPEIFYITLRKLGVNPEEALFIDDHIENVKAAKKIGINSILFTSTKDLEHELETKKISI